MKKYGKYALIALAIFIAIKSPELAAALVHKGAGFLGDAAQSATTFVQAVGK